MDKQTFDKRIKDQPFSVLNELAYQYIVEAIVTVKLVPDSKINTTSIAEELGISRTPIRMALDELMTVGLVDKVGGKGYKVKTVDWNDCMALYDARKVIEGTAAAIATNVINAKELAELGNTIQRSKTAKYDDNPTSFLKQDHDFHALIVTASHNRYFIEMHQQLYIWIQRYQHLLIAYRKFKYQDDVYVEDTHAIIFRALKNRYSSIAQAEMEDHIQHIYRSIFELGWSSYQPPKQLDAEAPELVPHTCFIEPENRAAAALNESTYRYLYDEIVEARILPGERINAGKIMQDLNISSTPMREALKRLQDEGLVERISIHEFRVPLFDIEDCFALCDARKVLEGAAAFQAASHITDAELEALRDSIVKAKQALALKDYDAFTAEDDRFHEIMIQASANRYYSALYSTLKRDIRRYHSIQLTYEHKILGLERHYAFEKHMSIYRALKNHYSALAKNEVEEHVRYAYRKLLELGWRINTAE